MDMSYSDIQEAFDQLIGSGQIISSDLCVLNKAGRKERSGNRGLQPGQYHSECQGKQGKRICSRKQPERSGQKGAIKGLGGFRPQT